MRTKLKLKFMIRKHVEFGFLSGKYKPEYKENKERETDQECIDRICLKYKRKVNPFASNIKRTGKITAVKTICKQIVNDDQRWCFKLTDEPIVVFSKEDKCYSLRRKGGGTIIVKEIMDEYFRAQEELASGEINAREYGVEMDRLSGYCRMTRWKFESAVKDESEGLEFYREHDGSVKPINSKGIIVECNVTDAIIYCWGISGVVPVMTENSISIPFIISKIKNDAPIPRNRPFNFNWKSRVRTIAVNLTACIYRMCDLDLTELKRTSACYLSPELTTFSSCLKDVLDHSNIFSKSEVELIKYLSWSKLLSCLEGTWCRGEQDAQEIWKLLITDPMLEKMCLSIVDVVKHKSSKKKMLDKQIKNLAEYLEIPYEVGTLNSELHLKNVLRMSDNEQVRLVASIIESQDSEISQVESKYATRMIEEFIYKFRWDEYNCGQWKYRIGAVDDWDQLSQILNRMAGLIAETVICRNEGIVYKDEDDKPSFKEILMELSLDCGTEDKMRNLINNQLSNMSDTLCRKPDGYKIMSVPVDNFDETLDVEWNSENNTWEHSDCFYKSGEGLKHSILFEFGWVVNASRKREIEFSRWEPLKQFLDVIGPVRVETRIYDDNEMLKHCENASDYGMVLMFSEFRKALRAHCPILKRETFLDPYDFLTDNQKNVDMPFPDFNKEDIHMMVNNLHDEKPIFGRTYMPKDVVDSLKATCDKLPEFELTEREVYDCYREVMAQVGEDGNYIWRSEMRRGMDENILGEVWSGMKRGWSEQGYVVVDTPKKKWGARISNLNEDIYKPTCDCNKEKHDLINLVNQMTHKGAISTAHAKRLVKEDRIEGAHVYHMNQIIIHIIMGEAYCSRLDNMSRIVRMKKFDVSTCCRAVNEVTGVVFRKCTRMEEMKNQMIEWKGRWNTTLMDDNKDVTLWQTALSLWCDELNVYCPINVVFWDKDQKENMETIMDMAATSTDIFERSAEKFDSRRNFTFRKPIEYSSELPDSFKHHVSPTITENIKNDFIKNVVNMHENEDACYNKPIYEVMDTILNIYLNLESSQKFILMYQVMSEYNKCLNFNKTIKFRRPLNDLYDLIIVVYAGGENIKVGFRNMATRRIEEVITIDQVKLNSYRLALLYNISIIFSRLESTGRIKAIIDDDDFNNIDEFGIIQRMSEEFDILHKSFLDWDLDGFMSSGRKLKNNLDECYSKLEVMKLMCFVNCVSGPAMAENNQQHNTTMQLIRFPYMFSLSDKFNIEDWGEKMMERIRSPSCQLHAEWIYFCSLQALSGRNSMIENSRDSNIFRHGEFIDPLSGIKAQNSADFINFIYGVHYYDRNSQNFQSQSILTMMDFMKPSLIWEKVTAGAVRQWESCCEGKWPKQDGQLVYKNLCDGCFEALNEMCLCYQVKIFKIETRSDLKRIMIEHGKLTTKLNKGSFSSPYSQEQFGHFLSNHFSEDQFNRVLASDKLREPISEMNDSTGCMKAVMIEGDPIATEGKFKQIIENRTIAKLRAAISRLKSTDNIGMGIKEIFSRFDANTTIQISESLASNTSSNRKVIDRCYKEEVKNVLSTRMSELTFGLVKTAVSSVSSVRETNILSTKSFMEMSDEEHRRLFKNSLRKRPENKTEAFVKVCKKLKDTIKVCGDIPDLSCLIIKISEAYVKGNAYIQELDDYRNFVQERIIFYECVDGLAVERNLKEYSRIRDSDEYLRFKAECKELFLRAMLYKQDKAKNNHISYEDVRKELLAEETVLQHQYSNLIKTIISYTISKTLDSGLIHLVDPTEIKTLIFNDETKNAMLAMVELDLDQAMIYCINCALHSSRPISDSLDQGDYSNKTDCLQEVADAIRKIAITFTDSDMLVKELFLVCNSAAGERKKELDDILNIKGNNIRLSMSVHSKVIFMLVESLGLNIGNSFVMARRYLIQSYRYQAANAPKAQYASRRELTVQEWRTKVMNHCIEQISREFLKESPNDLMQHSERKDEVLERCKEFITSHKTTAGSEFLEMNSADEQKWGPYHCTMGFWNILKVLMSRNKNLFYFYGSVLINAVYKQMVFPESLLQRVYSILNYKGLTIAKRGEGDFYLLSRDKEEITRNHNLMMNVSDEIKMIIYDFILKGQFGHRSYANMGQGIYHATSSLIALSELAWAKTMIMNQVVMPRHIPFMEHIELRSSDDSIFVMYIKNDVSERQVKQIDEFMKLRCLVRKGCLNISRSSKSCSGNMIAEVYSKFVATEDLIPAVKQLCAILTSSAGTSIIAHSQMLFNIVADSLDQGCSILSAAVNYRIRMASDKIVIGGDVYDSSSQDIPISMSGRFPIKLSTLISPLNTFECNKALRLHQSALSKIKSREEISLLEALSLSCPIIETDEDINLYKSQHVSGKSKMMLGNFLRTPVMEVVKRKRKELRDVIEERVDIHKKGQSVLEELVDMRGRARTFDSILNKTKQALKSDALAESLCSLNGVTRLRNLRSQNWGNFVPCGFYLTGNTIEKRDGKYLKLADAANWKHLQPKGNIEIENRIILIRSGITSDVDVVERMVRVERSTFMGFNKLEKPVFKSWTKIFRGEIVDRFRLPVNKIFVGIINLRLLLAADSRINMTHFRRDKDTLEKNFPNVYSTVMSYKEGKIEDIAALRRLCDILEVQNVGSRKLYCFVDRNPSYLDLPPQLAKYNVIHNLRTWYTADLSGPNTTNPTVLQNFSDLRGLLTVLGASDRRERIIDNLLTFMDKKHMQLDTIIHELKNTTYGGSMRSALGLKYFIEGLRDPERVDTSSRLFVRSVKSEDETIIHDTVTLLDDDLERSNGRLESLSIIYMKQDGRVKTRASITTRSIEKINKMFSLYMENKTIPEGHRFSELKDLVNSMEIKGNYSIKCKDGRIELDLMGTDNLTISKLQDNTRLDSQTLILTQTPAVKTVGKELHFGVEYTSRDISKDEIEALKRSVSMISRETQNELLDVIKFKSQKKFFETRSKITFTKDVKRELLDEFRTTQTEEVLSWCDLHSERKIRFEAKKEALQLLSTLPEPPNIEKNNELSYYAFQEGMDIKSIIIAICDSEDKIMIKQRDLKVLMRISSDTELTLQRMLCFDNMNKMMKVNGIIDNIRRVRQGISTSVQLNFCTFGEANEVDHTRLGLEIGDLYICINNELVDVRAYKKSLEEIGIRCTVKSRRNTKKSLISVDDWRAACCIAISVEFESNFAINKRIKALFYIAGMCDSSVLDERDSEFGSEMGEGSESMEEEFRDEDSDYSEDVDIFNLNI